MEIPTYHTKAKTRSLNIQSVAGKLHINGRAYSVVRTVLNSQGLSTRFNSDTTAIKS